MKALNDQVVFTFPVKHEMPVLRMGDREFMLSHYPDNGDTKRLVFTLTEEEFAEVSSGMEMWVQYGRDETTERWNFGRVDKGRANRR